MKFPPFSGVLVKLKSFDPLNSPMAKMGRTVLLVSCTITGMVLGLRALGTLESPELALYDQFIRLQPDRQPDDRLLIVGINESDLQTLQEWPISDLTLARAVEVLQTHQPRTIGIDLLRDIPIGDGRDRLLEQLLQKNVITVCKVNSSEDRGVAPPAELPVQSVGFSDLVVDPGGILRRSLLMVSPPSSSNGDQTSHLCNDPDNTLLSLNFDAALRYLEAEGIEASFNEENQLEIGSVVLPALTPNLGGYQAADAGGYQIMLRYRAEEDIAPIVSLVEVLEGQVADDLIRDRLIFIGYTTPTAKDEFYTPYSFGRSDRQKMPGVVIHAQSTSQILSLILDGKSGITGWSLPTEMLWIYGWALASGILAWYLRNPVWFGIGVSVVGGAAYGISLLLFTQGVWIPIFPTLTGLAITSVGVVLLDRFNNSAYGQKVYKKVKTFLNIEIDQEKLAKQVSEITDTDYFQDLKSSVKDLRSESSSSTSKAEIQKPSPSEPSPINLQKSSSVLENLCQKNGEDPDSNIQINTFVRDEQAYTQNPTEDSASKGSGISPESSIYETLSQNLSTEVEVEDDADDLDYLLGLKKQAQQLKNECQTKE